MATVRCVVFFLLAAAVGLNACAAEVLSGDRDARGSTYLYAVREKRWSVRTATEETGEQRNGKDTEDTREDAKGLSSDDSQQQLAASGTTTTTVNQSGSTNPAGSKGSPSKTKTEVDKEETEGEGEKNQNKEKGKELKNDTQGTPLQPTPEKEDNLKKEATTKDKTSSQDETKTSNTESTTTAPKDDFGAADGSHVIAWAPAVLLLIAVVHPAVC